MKIEFRGTWADSYCVSLRCRDVTHYGSGAKGHTVNTMPISGVIIAQTLMEPSVGVGPTTYRLQGGCSATELTRRNVLQTRDQPRGDSPRAHGQLHMLPMRLPQTHSATPTAPSSESRRPCHIAPEQDVKYQSLQPQAPNK